MTELKQYFINGVVYEVEYHYKDDTQRNKHITNTEVRFTRVSLEMARRFFEMELLDSFKMLVEIQEYEKITGNLPIYLFDISKFKIGIINERESQ